TLKRRPAFYQRLRRRPNSTPFRQEVHTTKMRGHTPAESKTKCRAALVAFALSLCALAATPAQARQQTAGGQRAPFTKENLVAFLRGLAPERRDAGLQMLAAAVRDSGVDFEVTP